MAIPGYFPVQLTGATLACPTVGAGLGSSITQLSLSVWTCSAGLQFNSTDNLIPGPGGGGFNLATAGGGLIPTNPGNVGGTDTMPEVTVSARNHSPAANIVNNLHYAGGAGTTLCYDQTAAGVRYASSLEVHYLIAVDFVGQRLQVWCNDSVLPLSSGSWGTAVAWANAALNWTLVIGSSSHAGDFWVSPTFIDWSVQANRRQFINPDLSAVQLPTNGQVTIGAGTVNPAIFLRVMPSGVASDFLTNHGTGPNWTVSSGSLTIAAPVYPAATSSCMGVAAPAIPPTPPSTVCGANNSTTAINPTWGASAGATSYTMQYSPAGQGLWTPISGITGTSYVVTGLTANTSYDWQVQAVNAAGASAWSTTTTCLTQPVQPSATLEPQRNLVWLDWSDSRGHAWSDPLSQSLGGTGHYNTNLQWNRLGFARDRVFRVTWTSGVRTVLQGAWLELTPGGA